MDPPIKHLAKEQCLREGKADVALPDLHSEALPTDRISNQTRCERAELQGSQMLQFPVHISPVM